MHLCALLRSLCFAWFCIVSAFRSNRCCVIRLVHTNTGRVSSQDRGQTYVCMHALFYFIHIFYMCDDEFGSECPYIIEYIFDDKMGAHDIPFDVYSTFVNNIIQSKNSHWNANIGIELTFC